MSRPTTVLGINIGHDGGAALVVDGDVRVAIAEERLNRNRYSSGWITSLLYCLETTGINVLDIDLVVVSTIGPWLPSQPSILPLERLGIPKKKVMSVDHHLSHAFGAFAQSGFEKALVAVIDGEGNEYETESFYIASHNEIQKVGGNDQNRPRAKGIGRTYEAFTNYLGWSDQECGKTMGLAAYVKSPITTPLFHVDDGIVSSGLEQTHERGVHEFAKQGRLSFGEPYGRGSIKTDAEVASYVQSETERVTNELITYWLKKAGMKDLVYTGGVALNCSVNQTLTKNPAINKFFVLPASSDRGQALGNAVYGYHKLTGKLARKRVQNDYFGRDYSRAEIEGALSRLPSASIRKSVPSQKFEYEKSSSIEKDAASLLSEGNIVGWFQGGSELGPRALGNRSILADPRSKEMKDKLNENVKHREPFRPFAPSVVSEEASDYFELGDSDSPYMLLTPKVKPGKLSKLQAVTHVDQTARVQTVTKKGNRKFYSLLRAFKEKTGIPVLLNTSFNDQEPIVETPGDAISTFLRTDIDYLVINNYILRKKASV